MSYLIEINDRMITDLSTLEYSPNNVCPKLRSPRVGLLFFQNTPFHFCCNYKVKTNAVNKH